MTGELTEMAGGTDGALSSGLELPVPGAEIGMMRSAFFAAGCAVDDSKKVAETVAAFIYKHTTDIQQTATRTCVLSI